MRRRWLRPAAVPLTLAFMVAAACSTSDNNSSDTTAASGGSAGTAASSGSASAGSSAAGNADLKGKEVTVFGSESSDEEAGAMQDALDVLGEQTGMKITFVGARDFEQQINSQVTGGNPPDIAIFPQPGKLRDFATSGDLKDLPDDVLATAKDNWSDSWLKFWQTADGKQVGVPVKSDLKSLVWYSPAAFKAKGYEVPKTKTDFYALVDKMIANGDAVCICIGSGSTFTRCLRRLTRRRVRSARHSELAPIQRRRRWFCSMIRRLLKQHGHSPGARSAKEEVQTKTG